MRGGNGMKRERKWRRALCAALALVIILTMSVPGVSAAESVESTESAEDAGTALTSEETEKETQTQTESASRESTSQTDGENATETEKVTETDTQTETKSATETETKDETESETETETETTTEDAEETEEEEVVKAASNITQDQAVAWARGYIGRDDNENYSWGAQCVVLIRMYYAYLGQAQVGGDAYQYIYNANALPSGAGWNRYTNAQTTPQRGDIVVFDRYTYGVAGKYGHIGIVTDVEAAKYIYIDYNACGGNSKGYTCPGGIYHDSWRVPCWGGYGQYRKLELNKFSCVIRPNFKSPDPPQPPPKPTIRPVNIGSDFYAYIRYAVNGTYVESKDTGYVDGAISVQTSSGNVDYTYCEPRQIWHFKYAWEDSHGPSYTISNAYGTLDALYGGQNGSYDVARGVGVCLYNNYYNNQRWYIDDIGGGKYRIVPVYSYEKNDKPAFFLDAGTVDAADTNKKERPINVNVKPGDELAFAQQFCIDKIEHYNNNISPITNLGDDFYATIKFGSNFGKFIEVREKRLNLVSFDNVQISAATQAEPRNIWHFIKDRSGKKEYTYTYKIVNEYNGQCLNVAGGNNSNGTNIQTWDDNGSPAQRFYIIRSRDGTRYRLMPAYCYRTSALPMGLVIDVAAGQSGVAQETPGTNVQIWSRDYLDGRTQTIDIQKLTDYQKPAAPAAPASVSVSRSGAGTTISWSAVGTDGLFDSRAYRVEIYRGDSAVGVPFIGSSVEDTDDFYTLAQLPKGTYTVLVKSVNTKYRNLVSAPSAAKTFKAGVLIELGFADTSGQVLKDGKIRLRAEYGEDADRDVRLVAASYDADGKMLASSALLWTLRSGASEVEIPATALDGSGRISVYCLDKATLAPLTDVLTWTGS